MDSFCRCLGSSRYELPPEMLIKLHELEQEAAERKANVQTLRVAAKKRAALWREGKRLLSVMRLNDQFDVEAARRTLLSNHLKEALTPFLPARMRDLEWHQYFSTDVHGTLTSAYQRWSAKHIKHPGPGVLLVMDSNNHVFGAFCPTGWEIQPRLHYYGNGECFLFRSMPDFEVYRSTHVNYHHVLAAHDSIAFGSLSGDVSQKDAGFGLWLDGDFTSGVSRACPTYGNTGPIASEEEFVVTSVEMWSLSRLKKYGTSHTLTQTIAFK
mmetsp:Transcript_20982/g.45038  ORF Transcript_20982/g.45038 Transcript_20982/m.45038 type:complete len:268 (-) Transcript_20982:295-1098(-)|eukprot:CAMPEP_0183354710 /NCGR_PEP_ID=MMETSP0164_2-20130417/37866_1 /TAXON_ID=221442 /ORGANISM="Coccolithus pelagicus ssp braarudi, Strain PLY182g" /LENGTH=267 /DNA_ID=CAMNT_0025527647 /DNA_START=205 /DNA_END=1008 /DNA_ORIENTATION=-